MIIRDRDGMSASDMSPFVQFDVTSYTRLLCRPHFLRIYLAFPSPLFAKKGGAYHVKHTLPIEIGTPSRADPRRHSLLSQFLRHKIGWCTPNHRPHHLYANACRNTVSLPHHHCTSHG